MWEKIIPYIGAILSLLVAVFTFLIKSIKNEKAKNILQQTLDITEVIQQYIIDAEKLNHFTGLEKKEFVITKANQFAIQNKIKFNEEQISKKIDELVENTKKVNVRLTDQEKFEINTNNNLVEKFGHDNQNKRCL